MDFEERLDSKEYLDYEECLDPEECLDKQSLDSEERVKANKKQERKTSLAGSATLVDTS